MAKVPETPLYEPLTLQAIQDRTVRENLRMLFEMTSGLVRDTRTISKSLVQEVSGDALTIAPGEPQPPRETFPPEEPLPPLPPIVGTWGTSDGAENGSGEVLWDNEFFAPSATHFGLTSGLNRIIVKSAGPYLVTGCITITLENAPAAEEVMPAAISVRIGDGTGDVLNLEFKGVGLPSNIPVSTNDWSCGFGFVWPFKAGGTLTITRLAGEEVADDTIISLYRLPEIQA